MADNAAFLVDRVLPPQAPYRQWVMTFPWALRRAMAFDADLANAVFAIVGQSILGWVRRSAEHDGVRGEPGGILQVQRAADAALLDVHVHLLVSEGVFARDEGEGVRFHRTRIPSPADLADVVVEVEGRVARLLERRCADVADCDEDAPPDARQLLLKCAAAEPARRRTEAGADRGGRTTAAASGGPRSTLCVTGEGGFNLHAGVQIGAHQKAALERMCRYLGRPPVADGRLRELDDGRIAVDLKRTWSGNVTVIEFEPHDLVARLCALVPPPRFPMLRYLGVLGPNAKLRKHVVPKPVAAVEGCPAGPLAPSRPARMAWAALMERVFAVDVLQCQCGGRLRIHAVIQKPSVIEAILASLIASKKLDPTRAGRGPPRRRRVLSNVL